MNATPRSFVSFHLLYAGMLFLVGALIVTVHKRKLMVVALITNCKKVEKIFFVACSLSKIFDLRFNQVSVDTFDIVSTN